MSQTLLYSYGAKKRWVNYNDNNSVHGELADGGWSRFVPLHCRNVYYLKKEGGEYKVGTIISDKSVTAIGFSEDINVRNVNKSLLYGVCVRMVGDMVSKTKAFVGKTESALTNRRYHDLSRLVCARDVVIFKRQFLLRFPRAYGD